MTFPIEPESDINSSIDLSDGAREEDVIEGILLPPAAPAPPGDSGVLHQLPVVPLEHLVLNPDEVRKRITKPTKLTPEVSKIIAANLTVAAPKTVAARAAGVSRATLYEWIRQGRAVQELVQSSTVDPSALSAEELNVLFLVELMDLAESQNEVALLQMVLRSGPEGAKWLLTRRYPDRWGNKATVEHKGSIALQLNWGDSTDPEQVQDTAASDDDVDEDLE